jgi:hypothetical protein
MKMLVKKITLVVALSFASSTMLFGAEPKAADIVPGKDDIPGWGAWTLTKVMRGGAFLKEKKEFLNLIEALMQIPYVICVDSTDSDAIRVSTMLAGAATATRLVNILGIPKNIPPALIFMWDGPKVLALVGAGLYDFIRISDAEKVAQRNSVDVGKFKSFKITQSIQLSIEIILRMLALFSKHGIGQDNGYSQAITVFASELADVVSIWRLLGRYTTYFMYVDEFALNWEVVIKKKDKDSDDTANASMIGDGTENNEVSEKTDVVGAGFASLQQENDVAADTRMLAADDQQMVNQDQATSQTQSVSVLLDSLRGAVQGAVAQ